MTTGPDCYVKIWNFKNKIQLISSVNLDHPLPIMWDIMIDDDEIYLNKLLMAIKSMDAVLKKYSSKMSFTLSKKFSFKNLINHINPNKEKSVHTTSTQ